MSPAGHGGVGGIHFVSQPASQAERGGSLRPFECGVVKSRRGSVDMPAARASPRAGRRRTLGPVMGNRTAPAHGWIGRGVVLCRL